MGKFSIRRDNKLFFGIGNFEVSEFFVCAVPILIRENIDYRYDEEIYNDRKVIYAYVSVSKLPHNLIEEMQESFNKLKPQLLKEVDKTENIIL